MQRLRWVWLAPALALVLAGAGCNREDQAAEGGGTGTAVSETADRAGDSAERTGDAARDTAGRAGERTEDAAGQAGDAIKDAAGKAEDLGENAVITAKVKSALIADGKVSASGINVDTQNGVVTLKGTVETAGQKKQAEAIAKKTQGVQKVVNKLTVKGK